MVDLETWRAARDELLAREKAHTREGDAIAAARRRLPMVEIDGTVEVVGPDGPVPFLELFQGRDELVIYQHMWWDGSPIQGQCEGCTTTAWHVKDAAYLNARGVSFAIVTSGPWEEVAPFVEFMGYTQPWYSVRGLDEPIGGGMGHLLVFLRDGDRVFLTYSTTGRGNEPVNGSLALLDMTPYGRREALGGQPRGLALGAAILLVLAVGRGRRRDLGGERAASSAVRRARPGAMQVETSGGARSPADVVDGERGGAVRCSPTGHGGARTGGSRGCLLDRGGRARGRWGGGRVPPASLTTASPVPRTPP